MNTVEKGNGLEDQLHEYLTDQLSRGELVFDAYPSALCKVIKKKKYYCAERGGDVEFDIAIEVRRKGRSEPHIFVLFECKNHKRPVQERDVTDFSDKIGRIFGHAAKGLIVTSSRLQSGAEKIARSRRLGIVKFDMSGIDVVADRTNGKWAEGSFLKSQFLEGPRRSKSLKFSAYTDGHYFCSPLHLLESFEASPREEQKELGNERSGFVHFIPEALIEDAARSVTLHAGYRSGELDVDRICTNLGLGLFYSEKTIRDIDGNIILGSINFDKNLIEVNQHSDRKRERFTIAHEIGHFCLRHDRYLRSETTVEKDLFVDTLTADTLNYERLEYQANLFASRLLLPEEQFKKEVEAQRRILDIYDRGFGYIFVDNQPCNYVPYSQLLASLSDHFGVSVRAVEIRLKRAGLVTDERRNATRLI